ncbi:type VI secretion system baseplate subunit TssF [Marinobacterium stanieri]|uniref:Type VI secretion system protein ImpG n=1 Tax=Marinobacterium stanieri TaxID=49186 RepID=A0A1N6X0P5_9GAMM|nr:type VI secretion system baseplate subunit TssF [Marinobacterium stanieri]SIQ95841.1 type VI secretion system protein ImpG [Marinobacterium stanieri]
MSNVLIDYYQRELNYLKRRGEAFAEEFPKVAARLQLTDDQARDPHVERIIQGIAFLNARVRKKLDDEFPQLCQTLMDVIYPHFLRPLPSYSIISFEPDKDLSTLASIPAGEDVHADVDEQYTCRFKTVYDAQVLPLKLESARLQSYPVDAPTPGQTSELESALKLRLVAINPDVELETTGISRLRFFIKGNRHYSFALYELIHNHALTVGVADNQYDANAVFMDASNAIQQVGFSEHEGIFDYPEQSFLGYRLLTEYFNYTDKFLFFDIELDDAAQAKLNGQAFDVFLYFNKSLPDIEATVDAGNFVLNATPLLNLYEQFAEPTRLTHQEYEYPVIADARHPDSVEVYSIDSVSVSADQSQIETVRPFFGIHGWDVSQQSCASWHSRREERDTGNTRSQVFLSLINSDELMAQQEEAVVLTRLKCFNGNLPKRLSQTWSQPPLVLSSGSSAVGKILMETSFSDVVRPQLGDDTYWNLLSHLNLNYVSLSADEAGTLVLRKMLSLYNSSRSRENANAADAVRVSRVAPSTMRMVDERGIPFFCRGSRVSLGIDSTRFSGNSPFLFASVLERFLGLYTHVNAFIQLSVELDGEETPLKVWPARAGEQALI